MVNFNVIKGYYWAKKSVDKIERYNMCIKIPAGSEKCVELLTIYDIYSIETAIRILLENYFLTGSMVMMNTVSVKSASSPADKMTRR